MTGLRIEIDVAAMVHQYWRRMPWRYRWLWLIPGERKRIEAMAVALISGQGETVE